MINTKLKDLLVRWSVLSGLDLTASIKRAPDGGALLTIEDRCSPAAYDMACFELQRPRSGTWVAVPIDEETGRPDRNCLVSAHRHPGLAGLFWPDGSADHQTIVDAVLAELVRYRAIDLAVIQERNREAMKANNKRDELSRVTAERDEAIKERDEAIKELQQAKAQKLQAVRVLVGVDECCEACRVTSENENRRRVGGDDE